MPIDDTCSIEFSEIYVQEGSTTWVVSPEYVSIVGYTSKTGYERFWTRFVRWFQR